MNSHLVRAEDRLRAFFNQMNAWELDSRRRSKAIGREELDPEESHDVSLRNLSAIFDEHCLATTCPGRGIRFQHPPEYDSETEVVDAVVSLNEHECEIHTRQLTGFKFKRVFTLYEVAGKWRIARKYRINAENERVEEEI
jgi:hypothetical protein